MQEMTQAQLTQCQNRQDWLDKRRTMGIGASEAPIILGVSRFKSPYQLWAEKLGLEPVSDEETEIQRMGLDMEPIIAARYERETNRKVTTPPPFVIYRDPVHPYMIASLDRWTALGSTLADGTRDESLIPLELKTAHWNLKGKWHEEPPLEYVIQVQHQLAVTGKSMGSVAAIVGGMMFLWCDIARDDSFIETLRYLESVFWEKCQKGVAPEVDASEATTRVLARLHARDNGQLIALPAEAIEWDDELQAVKEQIKKLHERQALNENRLKAALGDASGGFLANKVVYTYKLQQSAAYSVGPKEYRVLRRKGQPK